MTVRDDRKVALVTNQSARGKGGKVRVVTEKDLAFDSAKDLADQPTDAEADDWERRLNARS